MKVNCDYHPTAKAYWDCPSCEKTLCHTCVENRVVEQYGAKKTYHFCRKCNVEVDRIPFEDTVDPFWSRIPKFFLYPLKPLPLILILVVGLIHTALSSLGLLGFLLGFVLWAVILKYSYAALKSTANGQINRPPSINKSTLSDEFELVFKQIFLFFIIGFACVLAAAKFGPIVGLLFMAFVLLSLPSIIIILVATNSLLNSLNPVIFAGMAWRIGWNYLIMYLFLIFLLAAPSALWSYIIVYLPKSLHHYLIFCAKAYYTVTAYHLMGYVLFQHHEEIGYKVDLDDEEFELKDDAAQRDPEREILEKVNMLVKDGRLEDAIGFIRSETGENIDNVELAEKYFNLLKIQNNHSDMINYGNSYIKLLLQKNQKEKLMEAYAELSKNKGFAVSPEASFKVASLLNESNQPKEAIKVYTRFIKENSSSPLIPKAYFLAANTINEKLSNPTKAVQILKGILKKYPEHEIAPYVEDYLTKMGAR